MQDKPPRCLPSEKEEAASMGEKRKDFESVCTSEEVRYMKRRWTVPFRVQGPGTCAMAVESMVWGDGVGCL